MSTLISEEYRRMQEELHQNPNYGVASVQYAPMVADVLKQVGATEMLDYGAGKGRLGETLRTLLPDPPLIYHYDPARPEWSSTPRPRAFVACIDVLEHIEPDLLDNVLDDLQRVTIGHGMFASAHWSGGQDPGGWPQCPSDSAAACLVVAKVHAAF